MLCELHAGAAFIWNCLVLCEQTKAEKRCLLHHIWQHMLEADIRRWLRIKCKEWLRFKLPASFDAKYITLLYSYATYCISKYLLRETQCRNDHVLYQHDEEVLSFPNLTIWSWAAICFLLYLLIATTVLFNLSWLNLSCSLKPWS